MNTATTKNCATDTERATFFLPAERAPLAEVLRQHALLAGDPVISSMMESSLSLTVILNKQRQGVLLNEAFRARLNLAESEVPVGSRHGEYFGCVRASQAPSGCGTAKECRNCGAAKALAGALAGRTSTGACRIQTVICGLDLSLLVRASPFEYKGENFVMVSASDMEPELRRQQLERIFFHDVLNTASGVQGLLHVMQDADEPATAQQYIPIAKRASDTLIDELTCQRDLIAAESGELTLTQTAIDPGDLLTNLVGMLASHTLARDRHIVLTPDSGGFSMTTDKTLLSRVVLNLVKNALEAVPRGGVVTVSCRKEGNSAVFLVHNPTCMPPEVKNQLFQRSFSTKGAGRGYGTYSIRLLTETYLGGEVSFTSEPAEGTTFRAVYPLLPPVGLSVAPRSA